MSFLSWDYLELVPEGGAPPSGFQFLTGRPLVILVGLTGVGKSTVLKRLREGGLTFTRLPDRRQITDAVIIATLQRESGQALAPVTDRAERFEYTARYRARFPGGMSHALSRLAVDPARVSPPLLFDGLRGLDEVGHAVTQFSQGRFIVLDAPDLVRLNRLLQRGDRFDTVTGVVPPTRTSILAALEAIPAINAIFTDEQLAHLARAASLARVPADQIVEKAAIIVHERRNYDSRAARVFLQRTLPPDRLLVIDTAASPAEEVAAKITKWLGGIEGA